MAANTTNWIDHQPNPTAHVIWIILRFNALPLHQSSTLRLHNPLLQTPGRVRTPSPALIFSTKFRSSSAACSACSAACCCFRGFSSFICSKDGGKEKAPAKSGGGRRRRKWSKGKQKEKVNNAMLFDQPTTYDKLLSEVIYLSSCSLYYVLCWLRCLSISGNRSYEK